MPILYLITVNLLPSSRSIAIFNATFDVWQTVVEQQLFKFAFLFQVLDFRSVG